MSQKLELENMPTDCPVPKSQPRKHNTSNTIWTEHVLFRNIYIYKYIWEYIYMHTITSSVERDNEFLKRVQRAI